MQSLHTISLHKLSAHLAPRLPGARGEPSLLKFVLVANTYRNSQFNPIIHDSLYDLLDTSDDEIDFDEETWDDKSREEEEEEWLEGMLDELCQEQEADQATGNEVVLYSPPTEAPDTVEDDDRSGDSSGDEEVASPVLDEALDFGWDSLEVGKPLIEMPASSSDWEENVCWAWY